MPHHFGLMFMFQLFEFPSFCPFYWEDNPQWNIIHQTGSQGEKKENLNKYFIRLFGDLMRIFLAWVYGNISGSFLNALTQWYPTLA